MEGTAGQNGLEGIFDPIDSVYLIDILEAIDSALLASAPGTIARELTAQKKKRTG